MANLLEAIQVDKYPVRTTKAYMTTNNSIISLLRLESVMARTGLARSTIYKLISEGAFPYPVKITSKAVAWASNLIDDWIASRIANSKPPLEN